MQSIYTRSSELISEKKTQPPLFVKGAQADSCSSEMQRKCILSPLSLTHSCSVSLCTCAGESVFISARAQVLIMGPLYLIIS